MGGWAAGSQITVDKVVDGHGETYASCTGTRALPTLGGLIKGQLYYIRVFSYNNIGYSAPQMALHPQKPMVIPGGPTGVTLEVVSSYQLKVIFSPPDDDGGDTVVKYEVQWSLDVNFPANKTSSKIVDQLSAGAPYFYTIGSLTQKLIMGKFYYVRVRGANSQGFGPPVRSSPNSLNPSQPPDPPTLVNLGSTSPSMLTVTFHEPLSDGGDTITKYRIDWDKSPTFNSLELLPHKGTAEVAATERSFTI